MGKAKKVKEEAAEPAGPPPEERRASFSENFKRYAGFKDQFQGRAVGGSLPRLEGKMLEKVLELPDVQSLREALKKFAQKNFGKFDGEAEVQDEGPKKEVGWR